MHSSEKRKEEVAISSVLLGFSAGCETGKHGGWSRIPTSCVFLTQQAARVSPG